MGNVERFVELSEICKRKNDSFYKSVDEWITTPMLQHAACIGADAPTAPIRQDDEGIIPTIKFYRHVATGAGMSFDHEAAVAHAYAYLGSGLELAFAKDVQSLFCGMPVKLVT